MATEKTKVALVQMKCGPEPETNFQRAIGFIRDAAKQGAQIVCLPELFRSEYFCQSEEHRNFDLAEEIPGRSTSELEKLAHELGVVIIASLFEKRRAGVYHNTAVVFDVDGKLLGKYRKMHVPDDPLYHEKFYFSPGDLGFQAWETQRGKIGDRHGIDVGEIQRHVDRDDRQRAHGERRPPRCKRRDRSRSCAEGPSLSAAAGDDPGKVLQSLVRKNQ